MSLDLAKSGIDIKAFSGIGGHGFLDDRIRVGDYDIHKEDFVEMVMYFMTNTDLELGDIRHKLKQRIEELEECPGWNSSHNSSSVRFG